MKQHWFILIGLGSLLFGLSACGSSEMGAASAPVTEEVAATCDATLGHLFNSEESGICFVYPEDYCWLAGQDGTANSFVSLASEDAEGNNCPDDPLILHGEVVWVSVNVTPANGQLLDGAVATLTEGLEDFGLEMAEVMLDGETAVQINNMPGQDISRELLAIHDDQLYRFTFVPASADYGERYTQMQNLYSQIVTSFHFLP